MSHHHRTHFKWRLNRAGKPHTHTCIEIYGNDCTYTYQPLLSDSFSFCRICHRCLPCKERELVYLLNQSEANVLHNILLMVSIRRCGCIDTNSQCAGRVERAFGRAWARARAQVEHPLKVCRMHFVIRRKWTKHQHKENLHVVVLNHTR